MASKPKMTTVGGRIAKKMGGKPKAKGSSTRPRRGKPKGGGSTRPMKKTKGMQVDTVIMPNPGPGPRPIGPTPQPGPRPIGPTPRPPTQPPNRPPGYRPPGAPGGGPPGGPVTKPPVGPVPAPHPTPVPKPWSSPVGGAPRPGSTRPIHPGGISTVDPSNPTRQTLGVRSTLKKKSRPY